MEKFQIELRVELQIFTLISNKKLNPNLSERIEKIQTSEVDKLIPSGEGTTKTPKY